MLDGARVTEPGPERGIVFQQYSLLPWMTVYENVALAVDAVNPGRPAAERAEHHRGVHRAREPHAGPWKRPARAVGRHAPARGGGARPRHGAEGAADGRALQRARRAHAGHAPGRAAADLGRAPLDGDPGHQRRRRGHPARRPHLSDDAGARRRARPGHRGRAAAPARAPAHEPDARLPEGAAGHRGVPPRLPALRVARAI